MLKIIISDCDHANMIQEQELFAQAGVPFVHKACKTEEDLIGECAGYNVVVNQYAPFTRKVISTLAPTLKMVVRYGVGVNTIDVDAATEYGVQICNVPDYGMNEVADHAVALLLALARKVVLMDQFTKHETWEYSKCMPVYRIPGSVVGTVGFGRIGQVFAKRFGGFDVERIAYDPVYQVGTVIDGVRLVSFEELVTRCDMISIHCLLTPETENLFNLDVMKQMKPSAFLVNTARGGIINEADLLTALSEHIIAGAAIDVVAQEPMVVGHPLFQLENFICTPHMAWHSEQAAKELKSKAAQEALRFARGAAVHYPVNHLG